MGVVDILSCRLEPAAGRNRHDAAAADGNAPVDGMEEGTQMIITLDRRIELEDIENDGTPEHQITTTEYRRQQVVQAVIDCVYNIVHQGSLGSCEETEYLVSSVALKLVEGMHSQNAMALLKHDFQARYSQASGR
jgi:hypothetical protein